MSSSIQISGKARKTDNGGKHDHISNLPDCVMSHILSLLPMKDAMKTSVLSKDWKYKWTSIQDIEICDWKYKLTKATFVNFVERTLLQLQNLQSFHLSLCGKYELDHIKILISLALSRDVHKLWIFYYEGGIFLPCNLLNCHSLRKLVVVSPCTLKVPSVVCVSHLTNLCLQKVEILNEVTNSDPAKFNFPVLKTLELIGCKWLNVKFVEIYAPKMTSFMYANRHDAGVNIGSIKITVSSLARFEFHGDLPEDIVLSGSKVVYVALQNLYGLEDMRFGMDDVRMHEKNGLQIRKLLNGFSNLKDLELEGSITKAIALSKLGPSLPRYYKMKRLVLHSYVNIEALFELLHALPFLKVLVIHSVMDMIEDYDFDVEECYVPSCVASHLKEVEFNYFDGKMNHLKLVKFFLKNALKLKKMRLQAYPYPRMLKKKRYDKITKELCAYPKASDSLTIFKNF